MTKSEGTYSADRKGYHISWDAIPAWVCSQCGEPFFEAEVINHIQAALQKIDQETGTLTGKDRQLLVEASNEEAAVSQLDSHQDTQSHRIDKTQLLPGGIAIAVLCGLLAVVVTPLFWFPAIIGVLIIVTSIDWTATNQLLETSLAKAKQHVSHWLSRSMSSQVSGEADTYMDRREKIVLGFGFSIPVVLFAAFLTYWIGFRDNWEIDNYSQIAERCQAVDRAITETDDSGAAQAYHELVQFIGDHELKHDFIVDRVQSTREAYTPVQARIDEIERKREAIELAESQRREAELEAARRRQQAGEDAMQYQLTREEESVRGKIDWTLVNKARSSWRNFQNEDLAEQVAALIVIETGIRNAISDRLDREATLEYIDSNIDTW